MRVFLDTNVLVSALTTRGLCADVFRQAVSDHELVASEVVLVELRRILLDKIGLPEGLVAEYESFLRAGEVQPVPGELPAIKIRDRTDLPVLASALAAKADVLVTGDQDLLELDRKRTGIRIVSPRKFWDLLRRAKAKRAGKKH